MVSTARTRATSVTAAIAHAPGDPFEIATCELADPQDGEVLVRVHACGICHTDMAVKLQHIPIPMPKVLGHEGAGIIEKVGPGTTQFRPGDHVLMSFGSCGVCANCRDGALGYCDHFRDINLFGKRAGGSALTRNGRELGGHFFAQSAFATHGIATTRNVVKVDDDLPLELVAPLGCGIQTGMGTVMNVFRRPPARRSWCSGSEPSASRLSSPLESSAARRSSRSTSFPSGCGWPSSSGRPTRYRVFWKM